MSPELDRAVTPLTIGVRRTGGERDWSRQWPIRRAPGDPLVNLDAAGWFDGAGTYWVRIGFGRRRAETAFEAEPSDIEVQIGIWIARKEEEAGVVESVRHPGSPRRRTASRALFNASLTTRRVLPATPGVQMVRDRLVADWPGPSYTIQNHGDRAIHGVGTFRNFFGAIDRWRGDRWEPYDRGGFCATVAVGSPLLPGASQQSIEGWFIGDPRPLEPGCYRYVLDYSFDAQPIGDRLARVSCSAPSCSSGGPVQPTIEELD
jgi:hypothetical protein